MLYKEHRPDRPMRNLFAAIHPKLTKVKPSRAVVGSEYALQSRGLSIQIYPLDASGSHSLFPSCLQRCPTALLASTYFFLFFLFQFIFISSCLFLYVDDRTPSFRYCTGDFFVVSCHACVRSAKSCGKSILILYFQIEIDYDSKNTYQ